MSLNPFNSCYVSINGLKLPSSVEENPRALAGLHLKIKLLKGSSFVSRSFEYDMISKRKNKSFNIPMLVGATRLKFRFRLGGKKWVAVQDLKNIIRDELVQSTLDLARQNVQEGKIRISVIVPGDLIEKNELMKFAHGSSKKHFFFYTKVKKFPEYSDKIVTERALLFLRTHYDILRDVEISTRWIPKRIVMCLVKFGFKEDFRINAGKAGVEGNNMLQIEVPTPIEKNAAKIVETKLANQDHIKVKVHTLKFKKKVKGSVRITFAMLNKDNVRANVSKSIKVESKEFGKIEQEVKIPLFLDSKVLFVQMFSQGGLLGFSKKNLGFCRVDLTPLRKSPEPQRLDIDVRELKKVRGCLNASLRVNFSQGDLVRGSQATEGGLVPGKEAINHIVNVKMFYTKESGKSHQIFKTMSYPHFNAERFVSMHSDEIEVISLDAMSLCSYKIEGESQLDRSINLKQYSECYKVWYALKDPTRLEKEEEIYFDYEPSAPPGIEMEAEFYDDDSLPSAPCFEDGTFFEPSAPDFE